MGASSHLDQIPPRILGRLGFKILDDPVPHLGSQVKGRADERCLIGDEALFQGSGGYGCAREDAHPDPYIRHGWFQALQKGHILFHGLACLARPAKGLGDGIVQPSRLTQTAGLQ